MKASETGHKDIAVALAEKGADLNIKNLVSDCQLCVYDNDGDDTGVSTTLVAFIYVYVYGYVCICVCVYGWLYIHVYGCTYLYVWMYGCKCMVAYVYTYCIFMYAHHRLLALNHHYCDVRGCVGILVRRHGANMGL